MSAVIAPAPARDPRILAGARCERCEKSPARHALVIVDRSGGIANEASVCGRCRRSMLERGPWEVDQ